MSMLKNSNWHSNWDCDCALEWVNHRTEHTWVDIQKSVYHKFQSKIDFESSFSNGKPYATVCLTDNRIYGLWRNCARKWKTIILSKSVNLKTGSCTQTMKKGKKYGRVELNINAQHLHGMWQNERNQNMHFNSLKYPNIQMRTMSLDGHSRVDVHIYPSIHLSISLSLFQSS